jgi:hypothetical protein
MVVGSKGSCLVIWTSWHPCELSILPPTYLPCLVTNPKWYWVILSVFACEFASSGPWGSLELRDSYFSWWLLPPRWLRGSGGVVARVVIVPSHLLVICEGYCAFPDRAPKATLVNCSCHWATSLALGSCGALRELGFGLPISHRTMRCRSSQQGLACQQAREPRKKNLVSSIVYWLILPVIGLHIHWLVHPLRVGIKIISFPFTFLQTSCNKLFSVISCESLFYLCSCSFSPHSDLVIDCHSDHSD